VAPPAARRPGSAFGLLTVVPPTAAARGAAVPRDLIVLLDTSGSMGGEPLAQARKVVGAIIDTLSSSDRLEMIEFGNSPRRWKSSPVAADAKGQKEAHAWLRKLQASGGTEMRSGILEALRPLRAESQRQIVLVTDGLIGFENEVVQEIALRLPAGSRVHTVGVGSSVNRSLTGPAARAGRGVELVVGLGEDPERAARRLVQRTDQPLVVDVAVEGSAVKANAPRRPGDLFAGAPALIALELDPAGGALVVTGRTARGPFEQRIEVPPAHAATGGRALAALFGREAVEDLELLVAAGEPGHDEAIERLGLDFQIATRLTSWVAISTEKTVDPQAPTRSESIPQELPYGMSMEGLGLRSANAPFAVPTGLAAPMALQQAFSAKVASLSPAAPKGGGLVSTLGAAVHRLFRSKDEGLHDDVTESAPPEEQGELESAAAQLERRLRGKVTRRKGRELTIEIALDAPLDWAPPDDALLIAGGDLLTAIIDAARSTRAGSLTAKQTLRITLLVDGDAPASPDQLHFTIAGLTFVVELR
jgi:Ca-activated chloride channel homolog